MHQTNTRSLGFEWNGQFLMLHRPSVRPRLCPLAVHHCLHLLRSRRLSLAILGYLVDLVFAAKTARESLSTAQTLIHVLHREDGW